MVAAVSRFLLPVLLRFLGGFFFGTCVSAVFSRGLVLGSGVGGTSRAALGGIQEKMRWR